MMAVSDVGRPDDETSAEAREHVRLWDTHARAIYRFCFRRTADAALAEDLTSIVFLEAWRRRRDVARGEQDLLPWLYGVATNVLRNQRRSQRRHQAALLRLPRPLHEPDFADGVSTRLDDETQMRTILREIRKLSRLEQEILGLCVWEGLEPREAALALGIPEATVRTRLHRGRRHLQALAGANSADTSPSSVPVREGEQR
jgi:RNA polymerase sigma-70 factor (ECF subfamily)